MIDQIKKVLVKEPNLIRPHVIAKSISDIDFESIKKMGFQKIIFEQENILTKANECDFESDYIRNSFKECIDTFGGKNVIIITRINNPLHFLDNSTIKLDIPN